MSEPELQRQDAYGARLGAMLEADLDGIDPAHREALADARLRALRARPERARAAGGFWVPAGAFAAAVLAALALVRVPMLAEQPAADDAFLDLELIAADEQLEMLEELEFYVWLDSNAPD